MRWSSRRWCPTLSLEDPSIENLCIKGAMDCRHALSMDAARRAVALGVREDDLGIGLTAEVGALSPCPIDLLAITIRGELDEQGELVGGRRSPSSAGSPTAVVRAAKSRGLVDRATGAVALCGRLLFNTPWFAWAVARFLVVGAFSTVRTVVAVIIMTGWRLIARRSAKPVSQHIRWSSSSRAAAGRGGRSPTGRAGMIRPMSHPALSTIREEEERRSPSRN